MRQIAQTPHSYRRLFQVFVLGFLGLILLPTFDLIFSLDPVVAQSENRKLEGWPKAPKNFKDITRYAQDFTSFFSDNFGFRSSLIRTYGVMKVKLLGITSSYQVVLGKNGWLYLNNMGNVQTYRNLYPFTQAELEDFALKLKQRRAWCERRGIHFIFMITPDAHTMYSENLPDWMTKARPGSRMDQILDYLKVHTDIEVVDLREPLREAKKMGNVYYTTDSHWNSFGAYIGYREVMKRIHARYPGVPEARPLGDYELRENVFPGGDLTRLLGLQAIWPDYSYELVPRFKTASYSRDDSDIGSNGHHYTTFNKEVPEFAVIALMDSFAGEITRYLSSTFSQVRYMWGYPFEHEEILKYRPKVLLQSIVERSLSWGQGPNPPEVIQEYEQGVK